MATSTATVGKSDAAARSMKGAEIMVEYLVREKVPYLFGVCGHGNVGFLDAAAAASDRIKTVSCHHEQSAGYMADAYYKVKHEPVDVHFVRAGIVQPRCCVMRLAVLTKNRSNPAYAAARLGAERTARRLGASVTHYVPEKPDDVNEQIALIDEAIADKPDAVVLVPVHPTKINAAIRRIVEARIPLFGILNAYTEPGPITYVGADDVSIGFDIATYLYEHLGGRGQVVILEGAAHSVTSQARVKGFLKALDAQPSIRIAARICGEYLREPARRAMKEFLGTGTQFDAILAANDDMALGALSALEAAGRKSAVVGVNAIPEAITAIKQGRVLATADFNALAISEIATEAAIRHLRGEKLPAEIMLPVDLIDRANCGAWDKPFEERESMRWDDAVK